MTDWSRLEHMTILVAVLKELKLPQIERRNCMIYPVLDIPPYQPGQTCWTVLLLVFVVIDESIGNNLPRSFQSTREIWFKLSGLRDLQRFAHDGFPKVLKDGFLLTTHFKITVCPRPLRVTKYRCIILGLRQKAINEVALSAIIMKKEIKGYSFSWKVHDHYVVFLVQ